MTRKTSSARKRIVLGVTGSIACYKAPSLARYFMKRGCDVRVVMTESATNFVTPLTFESLTHNPVAVSFWNETEPGSIGHIELADWADAVVVAPATADCVAKMAFGMGESSVLAVILATKAPIIVAPAMNVNMYENPQTQENLQALQARGVVIVEPAAGDLACGWRGKGRLASERDIYLKTRRAMTRQDLLGKRVLISAGPTREAIDPVRYISNRSSGKMGIALANEAFMRGASVTLVHGPLAGGRPKVSHEVDCISVVAASEMADAIQARVFEAPRYNQPDIVIMAAAVADYRPSRPASQKVKKGQVDDFISIAPNEDILASLGRRRGESSSPLLVGFAVETGDQNTVISQAREKLQRKNVDIVVGNLAQDAFDRDTNQVWIAHRRGTLKHVATCKKSAVAREVVNQIVADLETDMLEPDQQLH